MKLYLKGHDYKYAVEQMLLAPRDVPSHGDPFLFTCSGGVNPPGIKVCYANAWTRHSARQVSSRLAGATT